MISSPMWFPSITLIFFFAIIISSTNAITNNKTQISKTNKTQVPKNNGMINNFIYLQNKARAAHRLPPLVWYPRLERYASSYAKLRQKDCLLQHSNGPYGENIFWGSGYGWNPAQAAAAWVGEQRWYAYGSNSCNAGQECGHYTQIVWKASRRIGCSIVNCFQSRGVFMICNYDPPGNYIGISSHVMTFEVGAVLPDLVVQAPAYCFTERVALDENAIST